MRSRDFKPSIDGYGAGAGNLDSAADVVLRRKALLKKRGVLSPNGTPVEGTIEVVEAGLSVDLPHAHAQARGAEKVSPRSVGHGSRLTLMSMSPHL